MSSGDEDIDPVDLFGAMALDIPVGLFGAWVVLKLYEWHVVPVWEGAPQLGYGRTLGLLVLLTLLKGLGDGRGSGKNDRIVTTVSRGVVLVFALWIGWLTA